MSNGYLRPAEGITQFTDTLFAGIDRGGINWNGECYRVIGATCCGRMDPKLAAEVSGSYESGCPSSAR